MQVFFSSSNRSFKNKTPFEFWLLNFYFAIRNSSLRQLTSWKLKAGTSFIQVFEFESHRLRYMIQSYLSTKTLPLNKSLFRTVRLNQYKKHFLPTQNIKILSVHFFQFFISFFSFVSYWLCFSSCKYEDVTV